MLDSLLIIGLFVGIIWFFKRQHTKMDAHEVNTISKANQNTITEDNRSNPSHSYELGNIWNDDHK